jgi:hypothetical protein
VIDWTFVARHALWIAGSSVALAAWSYGRIDGFTAPVLLASRIGALLFCVGFALVTPLWQAMLWTGIALYTAHYTWKTR